MKKNISKIVIITMTALVLNGCSMMASEDAIIERTVQKMEDTYNVDFDVVDYDYNKGSHQHEISLQSEYTDNNVAIAVRLESRDDYFDNYYHTRFCTEIKNTYLSGIDLGTNYYIVCDHILDLTTPIGYYDSYEDYKLKESDLKLWFTIYVDGDIRNDAESILRDRLYDLNGRYDLTVIKPKYLTADKCARMEQTHSHFYSSDGFITGTADYDELLSIETISYD